MPKEISEMSSPKLELRGRETGQSQLKVPESNIMSTETVKAKGHRKEVLRKFLTKTENLAGQVVEEGKQETVKIPQQIKNNTTLSKQTQDSPDLKMSAIKHETIKRDRKRDLLCIERQRALLEASLIKSRSHIMKMDKNIAAKEQYLKQLERITERENYNLEEFLKRSEEKSVDSRKLFEKESKSKQERNAAIKKLTDEIRTLKSKFAKIEEILNKYRRYKNVLFMLTPPEWHEGKEAEALKAKVTSDRDTQDVQNREPQESAIRQGLERGLESSPGGVLPSTREPMLSTAHSGTLITTSKLDCNSSEHEEKLELYFSDPQQLLDLQTELTEQNLSLIQNSTRGDETLEELRQNIETTLKKMKEDEEKLTLQDVLLDALGMKVTEVYCCCVDGRLTNLSTLEKLSSVEYRMSLQLQLLENIPEESLETLRQIKDSQRRSRLREEKLRLEREKQKERMKKCMQRSLGDTKKIRGRKLMPRCIPVELKSKVSDEDNIPAEDELHAYLFTTEDVE
ncbi:cilia- and flagella-associated protein 100-like isoform X2 [Siniperca chuatsi]|uniref:cilia- and flagella-associated protein 100-like isoform X2 n=1 Tax=Siniperca chuatsi TaxID=119488 RepID=UPI001CE0468A|nr:cilia- and flagella-associated protein 100-like isoform X2 [Siniperca chuatsi]